MDSDFQKSIYDLSHLLNTRVDTVWSPFHSAIMDHPLPPFPSGFDHIGILHNSWNIACPPDLRICSELLWPYTCCFIYPCVCTVAVFILCRTQPHDTFPVSYSWATSSKVADIPTASHSPPLSLGVTLFFFLRHISFTKRKGFQRRPTCSLLSLIHKTENILKKILQKSNKCNPFKRMP